MVGYKPYEAHNLANEKRRKLKVFDRKLEGRSHLVFTLSFWLNIIEKFTIHIGMPFLGQ